jgi:hypothetical protein
MRRTASVSLARVCSRSLPYVHVTAWEISISPSHHHGRSLVTSSAPSSTAARDAKESKSTRQVFKETSVHPSIRRYIEMIGVGIPSRRKRSASARQRLWDDLEEGRRSGRAGSATLPPPPFGSNEGGRHRTVVIGSIASVNDTLPTNQDRIPEVVRLAIALSVVACASKRTTSSIVCLLCMKLLSPPVPFSPGHCWKIQCRQIDTVECIVIWKSR